MRYLPLLSVSAPLASAGTVLWSGLFNESYTVEDFDKCTSRSFSFFLLAISKGLAILTKTGSWSSQLPPYQWYIHGSGDTSSYLDVSPDYQNPNSTLDEAQGVRITIDDTSSWNGQTMMRSELIPQVEGDADLGSGKLFYHFSFSVKEENFPVEGLEHQVAFFEVCLPFFSDLGFTNCHRPGV